MRRIDVAKPVLRADEMGLVCVAVPAGAGVGRDLDPRKLGLALLDRLLLVVGIDENVEIGREVLALERQHVVDVRIHLEVGIGDRFLPQLFPFGRKRLWLPFLLMGRGIDLQEKPKEVDDPAGILVAKAAGFAIGAARIERKDRLEVRRLQLRRHQLLGAEAGYAHHPDIAVAPGLRRDPFDEIVAVERARSAAFRLADAAGISDHVHVAARDEKAGVAGFRRSGPQHRPCRMRQGSLRQLGALQVLVVDRKGQERRELVRRFRSIDIDGDLDAVAHGHEQILLRDHPGIAWCAAVPDRRPLSGQREFKSPVGRRVVRHEANSSIPHSHYARMRLIGAASNRIDKDEGAGSRYRPGVHGPPAAPRDIQRERLRCSSCGGTYHGKAATRQAPR